MMRVLLALLVLATGSGAGVATACDCVPPLPPGAELAKSTAVFIGRVLTVEAVEGDRLLTRRITLEKVACWKGAAADVVVLRTADNGAACGLDFRVGEKWLVYADGQPNDLRASLCSRSWYLEHRGEDVAALGRPTCAAATLPSAWSAVKQLYDRW